MFRIKVTYIFSLLLHEDFLDRPLIYWTAEPFHHIDHTYHHHHPYHHITIISRLSVGCKNHELGQLLPIKYSLNILVDGPIEAAHCLPISLKYEQNALLILDLSSVWVLLMLKI